MRRNREKRFRNDDVGSNKRINPSKRKVKHYHFSLLFMSFIYQLIYVIFEAVVLFRETSLLVLCLRIVILDQRIEHAQLSHQSLC